MPFCSKFIKKTVYQILLESPEFSRKYFKKHVGLFFGHTVYLLVIFVLYIVFFCTFLTVFTALHAIQTRSSDEKAVCLSVCRSVCPSGKRVDCDKTEERSVQIFIPYERSFSLVF